MTACVPAVKCNGTNIFFLDSKLEKDTFSTANKVMLIFSTTADISTAVSVNMFCVPSTAG